MDTFLDSLIRFYEFRGRETVVTDSTVAPGVEARLLDLPSEDKSTFPYLP